MVLLDAATAASYAAARKPPLAPAVPPVGRRIVLAEDSDVLADYGY
jgi:hypothetical protein